MNHAIDPSDPDPEGSAAMHRWMLDHCRDTRVENRKYVSRLCAGRRIWACFDERITNRRPLFGLSREAARAAPFRSREDAATALAWLQGLNDYIPTVENPGGERIQLLTV